VPIAPPISRSGAEFRRGGPIFRWLGEELAIDLANTILVVKPGETWDLLGTRKLIDLWLKRERERVGSAPAVVKRPGALIELRDAIYLAFIAAANREDVPAEAVSVLNAASAAAPSYPQLVDGARVLSSVSSSPVDELLARIARSAIEILGTPKHRRLRACPAPNCGMFFLARPKQQWCCSACGNRARVARHYRKSSSRITPRPRGRN
jgi:predicted RNA-binding Zn ribbon-like protein